MIRQIGGFEVGKVQQIDALDLLRGLPDGSVDVIMADPPFELTELDFDQQEFAWALFWREARRVLARPSSPVVLFSQQPFTTDLIISNRAWWHFEIVVEFTMPVGYLNAKRQPLRCHQNVEVFSEKAPYYNPVFEHSTTRRARVVRRKGQHGSLYGAHKADTEWNDSGKRYPRSVWHFAQRENAFAQTKTLHPTQKPLALMERLVETFSQPDQVIVDCFAGSGTTGLAALKLQRQFIGADNGVDPKTGLPWAEVANRRLAQPYTSSLFTGAT